MSTTPSPVITVVTAQTWLQKHEKLILVTLLLIAASWLGDRWLRNRAAHDQQTAAIASQQLNEQKAQDAQIASQVVQLGNQYREVVQQLSEQNAQLAVAMTKRTVVLQQQQASDKAMPLPDLGNRWASLVGIAPAEMSATPTGINVSEPGARQTVAQLEKVPVLTANLKDETTVADNRQQELTTANGLIDGLNLQVSSLNTTIKTEETTCKAQIASVKATANKAKSKWFKIGFVTGFISGLFVGHQV